MLLNIIKMPQSLRQIRRSLDKKYTQLLISLVINFMSASFLLGNIGRIVLSFIFVNTMITIVRTFSLSPKVFKLYNLIALLAFILEIISILRLIDNVNIAFSVSVQLVYMIYLATGAYLIFRDILFSKKVTVDTILGAICIYFLIGLVWSFIYSLCGTFDENAFSQSIRETGSFSPFLYFSFTTLTTVGYGDISPVSDVTRMFTNLQAIIGQMYPAIIISILVSIYTSGRVK